MRTLLVIIMLCVGQLANAAISINGATIEAFNYVLDIYVSGITAPTNGGFNFGTDSGLNGCRVTNAMVLLTYTAEGFNASGVIVTNVRSFPATAVIPQTYPNQAYYSVATDGSGNPIIRCSLGQNYIYSTDSNLTLTVKAGWLSNNVLTTVVVTNLSTDVNPKPIGNWTMPGWQRITNTTMTLRCWAYALDGIACVKLTASDQSGHVASNYVSVESVDWTTKSPIHAGEYMTTLNISTFHNTDLIRSDMTFYPLLGTNFADTTGVLGVNALPISSQTNECDVLNTNGFVVAIIDPTNGIDASGQVVAGPLNTNSPPLPYRNMSNAWVQMRNTNKSLFGRLNLSDCILYATNGSYMIITNCDSAMGTNNWSWATLTPYPGVARSNVIITATTTAARSDSGANRLCISNCTFNANPGGASFILKNYADLWISQGDFVEGTTAMWGGPMRCYATWNTIEPTYITNGSPSGNGKQFDNFSTDVTQWMLIRGNTTTVCGAHSQWLPYMVMENVGPVQFDTSPSGAPPIDGGCIYNNKFYNCTNLGNGAFVWLNGNSNGFACVQNIFETATNLVGPLFADDDIATLTSSTNKLMANDVIVGQRLNLSYCSDSNVAPYRMYMAQRWIISQDNNIKWAPFTGTGGTNANSLRTNNMSALMGVDYWDNYSFGIVGGFGFTNVFTGLNSIWCTNAQTPVLKLEAFYDAEDYLSGNATTNGNGNYHLQPWSDILRLSVVPSPYAPVALPFDIDGMPRGMATPGPYAWFDTSFF